MECAVAAYQRYAVRARREGINTEDDALQTGTRGTRECTKQRFRLGLECFTLLYGCLKCYFYFLYGPAGSFDEAVVNQQQLTMRVVVDLYATHAGIRHPAVTPVGLMSFPLRCKPLGRPHSPLLASPVQIKRDSAVPTARGQQR